MSSAGTVIATIAAAVCTSVSAGTPNQASTSTDNTVTWGGTFALPATILAKGALGFWKLDESTVTDGSPAEDSTANNRDGTYFSIAGGTVAGPGGNYRTFGTGARVEVADANDWSLTNGKTLFIITRPAAVNVNYQTMHKMQSSNYEYTLQQSNPGIIDFQVYTSGASLIRRGVTTNNVLATGQWNVQAVTIDSTPSGSSTITINHNGSWKSVTHSGSGGGR